MKKLISAAASLSILFRIVLADSCSYEKRPDVCYCEKGCKLSKGQVPSFALQSIRKSSPRYTVVVPKTRKSEKIDNVCYTYFNTEDSKKLLLFRSIVNVDGSVELLSNLEQNPDQPTGEVFGADPYCSYHEYILGNNTCEDSSMVYRCFVHGICRGRGVDIERCSYKDAVYSNSGSRNASYACKEQVMADLLAAASDFGLCAGSLIILPQNLPHKCVTLYNGVPCLNADKVAPEEAVSVP